MAGDIGSLEAKGLRGDRVGEDGALGSVFHRVRVSRGESVVESVGLDCAGGVVESSTKISGTANCGMSVIRADS